MSGLKEHQYLLDRYSQSLTKYDSQNLFHRLMEKTGSLSAATKEVEITRKTVYDWENSAEDLKTITKRKILDASLEVDPYETLDFLVRKSAIDYHEVLERYINASLDRILATDDPKELQLRISDFEKYILSHNGGLFEIKTIPIEEITHLINKKAASKGVKGIATNIDLVSPRKLAQKFISLLEVFSMKTMTKHEMPNRLGLPKEFVDRACHAISYIDPSGQLSEDILELATEKPSSLDIHRVGFETTPYGHLYSRKAEM
jgi:hypothetical protein